MKCPGQSSPNLPLPQDLVRRALDVEPSRRPTAAQVLSHPWMTAKELADTRLTHDNPALMKVGSVPSLWASDRFVATM